jgi:hypothetical protein
MQLNVNISISERPMEKPTASFTRICLLAVGLKFLFISSVSIGGLVVADWVLYWAGTREFR